MKGREVLKGLGYITGADMVINHMKESDRLRNENRGKPIKQQGVVLVKELYSHIKLHAIPLVLIYRLSGTDIAIKGFRKANKALTSSSSPEEEEEKAKKNLIRPW